MKVAVRLLVLILALLAGTGTVAAALGDVNSAAGLRAKYSSLGDQLRHNQFQRPLYLESTEAQSDLAGDIYALVEYPFAAVGPALASPANWCDVMIVHQNTKFCRASSSSAPGNLVVNIGRKYDQPVEDAYRFDFAFRAVAQTQDYLQVQLTADKGPLGTSNYRIILEAVSVPGGRTFLHLSYAYGFGFAGRVAMEAYLATAGRNKVGFTLVNPQSGGQPEYIKGMRAIAERNTMRYYLAIDAFLSTLSVPPEDQFEKRIQYWYGETERYARQLHEVERGDYLAMKRRERQRLQAAK